MGQHLPSSGTRTRTRTRTRSGAKKLRAPDHKAAINPRNAKEFFAALMCPVFEVIKQPISDKSLQHYLLPFPGYEDLDQPRKILELFEANLGTDIEWKYFNGSDSSTAQMAQACDPTKAACENVTNTFDACNMLACQEDDAFDEKDGKALVKPSMATVLTNPMATAEHYFGLCRDDFSDPNKFGELRDFAKSHCVVRVFGGYPGDSNPCVLDVVDAGCGVAATDEDWENTLLSLNRGFKKYLTVTIGKWGWGAAGCFQNADFSVLVSCVPGTKEIMFTVVEKAYMAEEDRVPTFRYLTIKGNIPKVKAPKWWKDLMMPGEGHTPSTVIRHFGYQAPLSRGSGEKSIGGVLDRLLPDPVFPVWSEYIHMVEGKFSFPGHRRTSRLVRGTRNKLRDSWKRKQHNITVKKGGTDLVEVRHYDYFDINLGNHNFAGRTGVCPAGTVRAEIFVIEPREGQSEVDALRNLADPQKCVLFHLDGQTHHEEHSSLVGASTRGASLAHVGRRCVLLVDCNNLSRESKFALFGSSREQMKGSELHKRLKELIIKRLANDKTLRQIDGEIAMERRKNMKMPNQAEFADALERYMEKTDLQFPKLRRKGKKRVQIFEEQERKSGKKTPPPPIEVEMPPRLLQWALKKKVVKMYPGQSYSWVLETSAPASWWNASDPTKSHIKVLTNGVTFTGSDSFKAGRIRCHFECPSTAKPGDAGLIMAQMDYHPDYDMGALVIQLKIEVVAKSKGKLSGSKSGSRGNGDGKGKGKKIVKVPVWKDQITEEEVDFLPPQPLTFAEHEEIWRELGWERDASRPAFTVAVESKEAVVYYNPENKDLIEARDATVTKHPGTEEKFLEEYRMKLALEGIFMLNEATFQDTKTSDEACKRIYHMNRATARNLAMDVARELDLESKLDAERAGKQ